MIHNMGFWGQIPMFWPKSFKILANAIGHIAAISALMVTVLPSVNAAAPYPSRPIRLIVPIAAGGSVDIAARAIAVELSAAFGQQVVVDNRPGAGGNIGAELAARSPADGYTLIVGSSSTFGVNPTLYQNLKYDAVKNFSPVSLISLAPNVMVVHPSVLAKNVSEFISLAKGRPGKFSFASSGTGGSPHLAGELFKLEAGVDILHIPYKGTGQALSDLIGGQVQLSFGTVLALLPHIQSGKLRPLAVTSRKRVSALPEVLTMSESGLPNVVITAWNGVLAPSKTMRPIVLMLNREIVRILNKPDAVAQFSAQGAEAAPNSPEEFSAYILNEINKWGRVVRAASLKAN
jgi:tripartite-type tricarboxylate transporter receptor subunit TctC